MVIKNLSEWLFPGDGDGETHPSTLRPDVGAAGLLIAAAHRDGRYTDIEKDLATACLMKIFMLNNPEATALRKEAEKELHAEQGRGMMSFAMAAKGLDREVQEGLIRHLWGLVQTDGETLGENVLISSIRDALGFSREQAEALRPVNA